jgi:probable F420-dependent oxidoreductase
VQFGFTLKPEHSIERTLALTRQAEAAGFEYGWLFDSHVLWREPYVLLTLMAQATDRLRLGTCVTNPGTREPSVTASALAVLDEVSDGRMDLGIGRGDSARRVLGKPPITIAHTEEAIRVIRALVAGETIEYEGTPLNFPWTRGWRLPVWIAGYGPMALAMTGRIADGVILQLADPDLVRWFVGQVRDAAVAAGRDPASIRVQAAAPAHLGDLETCRERTRWFPALVSNHVVDLVNKYPREQLPPALTGYVKDRTGYDYHHHAEVGSSNAAFVGDEVTDRFCVLGSVADHVAKLRELADAGVDQFNIYLMNGDEESILEAYGREVIPALAAVRPGRPA